MMPSRRVRRLDRGLDHGDIVMALSKTFRRKGPVLAESSAFLMAHAGLASAP